MSTSLSEEDKLVILLVASVLIVLTLVITTCVVRPQCLLNRIFVKSTEKKKPKKPKTFIDLGYPPASLINNETQHFHLSVVPVYGQHKKSAQETTAVDNGNNNNNTTTVQPLKQLASSLIQYENLTQLAEKARLRYTTIKANQAPTEVVEAEALPKIDVSLGYEQVSEWAIRLHISIHRLLDLKMKAYLVEPSCYVSVVLVGNKSRRRSIINKSTQSELYRSETIKRSVRPVFTNATFTSEELPRSLLKEGTIKLRVMDDERYANDTCIGQVTIPLRNVKPIEQSTLVERCTHQVHAKAEAGAELAPAKNNEAEDKSGGSSSSSSLCNVLVLFPIKEIKGELLVGFCYLPTSRRINVTIVKGSLRHSMLPGILNGSTSGTTTTNIATTTTNTMHQAFFAKVLMFNNGKLIMKRRTSLSIRLLWDKNETLAFELPNDINNTMATTFMVVLAFKLQNSTSPLSPELPNPPEVVATAAGGDMDKDANNNNNNNNNSEQSQSRKNSAANCSRKDRCIGKFVLDADAYEEIIKSPRKQILKYYKLC